MAGDDPVVTFASVFVIVLATLKYWSPDEQLERSNKAKEDSSLRAITLRMPDSLADPCVSSGMALRKGTGRLAHRSSPCPKRETGVNEPTTATSRPVARI